jgi:hypothetical protein
MHANHPWQTFEMSKKPSAVRWQGRLTRENYGRDHHPRCFSVWLTGGGIKPGVVHGETDDFSYNIVRDAVHIHALNATILHCLGIDHRRLTYRVQGSTCA